MSVTTTVDELKESVTINIRNAINDLNKILDPDVWGYDDIPESRLIQLIEIQTTLRKIHLHL